MDNLVTRNPDPGGGLLFPVTKRTPKRKAPGRSRGPFKLFKPRGKATWWVGFEDDGQEMRKNLNTEDREEAERLAWALHLQRIGKVSKPGSDPLIGPLLREYVEHLYATKAHKTARERKYSLRRFFRREFTDLAQARLSEVTTNRISRHIDQRLSVDKLRPWSVVEIVKSLSGLFGYAMSQHGYPENPTKGVPLPRTTLSPIDYLKLHQIQPLFDLIKAEDPVLFAPVAIAIFAGLRRSEIIWLTWEDVDLERRVIAVRPKVLRGTRYETKTGKSRAVPISPELHPILAALPRKTEFVCCTPTGLQWQPNHLSNRLRMLLKFRKLAYAFNTFRHTFGSQLAQKGLSLFKICTLMGNTEEVCRQHYAALAIDEMQEEVSFMSRGEA
jgi:integrase